MNTKPYYFFLLTIIFLLSSCSDEVNKEAKIEYTSSVEKLVEHTNEFIPKVYSYDNGIHVAVGFGIANSIMVEGEGGNIIIDAADSIYEAEKIYSYYENGNIKFENASFKYLKDENQILNTINLDIPGKKMTALVGHSGAGKTTILNLIPRFYNINSGDIKIDNQSIYNSTVYSLRNNIYEKKLLYRKIM